MKRNNEKKNVELLASCVFMEFFNLFLHESFYRKEMGHKMSKKGKYHVKQRDMNNEAKVPVASKLLLSFFYRFASGVRIILRVIFKMSK